MVVAQSQVDVEVAEAKKAEEQARQYVEAREAAKKESREVVQKAAKHAADQEQSFMEEAANTKRLRTQVEHVVDGEKMQEQTEEQNNDKMTYNT